MVIYEFIYNRSQWRDVFEGGVFKRQMYVKSKKLWKDKIVATAEGIMNISPAGHYKRMYLIDTGHYIRYESIHNISKDDDAFYEFVEYISNIIPSFKFWVKKLESMNHMSLGALDVLMLNKDIPETESMLICHMYRTRRWDDVTMRYTDGYVTRGRWEISPLLITAKWRKMKKCDRVKIINEYRRWCDGNNDIDVSLPFNSKRIVDELLHRNEPDFIVRGWENPRTGVTNRDIEWLRTIEPEILPDTISCYHDWLRHIEDRVTDITDPYFRHQRDWREQHDRMIEERDQARAHEREIYEAQREQRIADFEERYAKYTDVLDEDGWHVYISNDYKAWKKRAYALRQCIVACEYYDKKNEVLIFVDKGGKPRYTCEVFLKDKHIGQFYGDESRGSKDLKPGKDVHEIVQKYIQMYL